ncbi:MAG: glycosyl hydrolase [Gammaproteobacteria bacterium]|nr:glycosyl hydrolase [Gammaproteobacteria bacterium]
MSDGQNRTIRVACSAVRAPAGREGFKLSRTIASGLAALVAMLTCVSSGAAEQLQPDKPWMNPALDTDSRTRVLLEAMTRDEKLALVFGYFSSDAPWKNFKKPAAGLEQSAGYVGGSSRLGIPALMETDAGTGVASQPGPNPRLRTALPSNLATAASWDPDLAYAGGRMIGNEARLSGFNVLLAGGINLLREPRNGRNFEYGGEDPLLAANIVAAQIRGIQSNHIISTIKHYALNDQETNRTTLSVHIDDRSARMSDLLAFELAIAQSSPGAVMCAYNRVNEVYSCESRWLLDEVLKSDWGYKGFVMSDWGATHSTIPAANAGLDQQSGYPFDASPYFADALKEAVEDGYVPAARLDDMAARILRSMFVNGLFDEPVKAGDIDFAGHAEVSRAAAEGAMVLLKNDHHLLPLAKSVRSILIVGSHADAGVLSGGGSSQVYPVSGTALLERRPKGAGPRVYFRSSPMQALAAHIPARITYDAGTDIKAAAKLARHSDVVIVFARQWTTEGLDSTMHLDEEQDALIVALARVNAKTVVVLETGGPVLMPWVDKVAAVLEAWYPGSSGGEAIARVLVGEVNPSGRLPVTFPRSLEQLPRPHLDGFPEQHNARFSVDYTIEGAAVGYKWFDRRHFEPLFPFGHGLSYSKFDFSNFAAEVDDKRLSVRFAVKNTGDRAGKYVAQVYVSPIGGAAASGWEAPKRLSGFKKVSLQPGEGADVSLSIEPRILAVYDDAGKSWVIEEGDYDVSLSTDARTVVSHTKVHIPRQIIPISR